MKLNNIPALNIHEKYLAQRNKNKSHFYLNPNS